MLSNAETSVHSSVFLLTPVVFTMHHTWNWIINHHAVMTNLTRGWLFLKVTSSAMAGGQKLIDFCHLGSAVNSVAACFHVVALQCWANIKCVNIDCHEQNCLVVLYSKANSPNFITTANNQRKSIWDGWEGCKVPTSKCCKLSMVCSLQIVLQFIWTPVGVGNAYTQYYFK